jgi:hypothetical protein
MFSSYYSIEAETTVLFWGYKFVGIQWKIRALLLVYLGRLTIVLLQLDGNLGDLLFGLYLDVG